MSFALSVMGADYAGLAWSFHVSPDSCDNPAHYENYLRLISVTDQNDGFSFTHIVLDDEKNRIAGYIALRVTALLIPDENGKLTGRPALEVYELAVDRDYERQGVGRSLIDYAIYTAAEIRRTYAGVQFICVCADPAAVPFYEKQGFSRADAHYDVPHDGSNDNCIPLFMSF